MECPDCSYMNKPRASEFSTRERIKNVLEWIAAGIILVVVFWILGAQRDLDFPWWTNFFFGIPVYLIMLLLGKWLNKRNADTPKSTR